MLTINILKTKISVAFSFLYVIAASAADRENLTLLCLLYCLMHEAAHLFVMIILGVGTSHIVFYGGGIKIISDGTELLSKPEKLAVYSAGCIENTILAALLYILKDETGCIINLFLAAFNLLPIDYFDGGKIIGILVNGHDKLLNAVSKILTFTAVISALAAAAFLPDGVSLISRITLGFIMLAELSPAVCKI